MQIPTKQGDWVIHLGFHEILLITSGVLVKIVKIVKSCQNAGFLTTLIKCLEDHWSEGLLFGFFLKSVFSISNIYSKSLIYTQLLKKLLETLVIYNR